MKPIYHILLLILLFPICALAVEMDRFTVLDMRHGLKESRIRDIKLLPTGEVAIATTATIDIFDGSKFLTADLLKPNEISLSDYNGFREIFYSPDSVIWIKNYRSLHAFRLPSLAPMASIPTLLASYGITYTPINLYISENVLYTVSPKGELYAYNGNTNRLVARLPLSAHGGQSPQKIVTNSIHICMCYENGDMFIIDRPTGKIIYSGKTPSSNELKSYSRGINIKIKNGLLYFSRHNKKETLSEIYVFDMKMLDWNTITQVPCRISDLDIDSEGNCIVISNKGYLLYSPDMRLIALDHNIPVQQGSINDDLSAIAIDSTGGIWLGTTENGLLYSNTKRLNLFKHSPEPYAHPQQPTFISENLKNLAETHASGITNCTAQDGYGLSYVGTRNGLMIFDKEGSPKGVVCTNQGLTSANIQSILTTSRYIFATTSNSIIRLKPIAATDSTISGIEITNYGMLDGISLDGKEFRAKQLMMDSSGYIHAGSPDGRYIFHPDSLPVDDRPHYTLSFSTNNSATNDTEITYFTLILLTVLSLVISLTIGIPFRQKQSNIAIPQTETDCSGNKSAQPSIDDEFIRKLSDLIISNIEDCDLSVTQLSSMMAMDRTVLYRKTQANLAMSPSAYIKTIRIREAKRLLSDTNLLIADIATKTGFSTPKYFTQTFKEITTLTPSAYRQAYQKRVAESDTSNSATNLT